MLRASTILGRLYDAYRTAIKILRRHEEAAHFIPDVIHIDRTQPPGRTVKEYPHIYEVAVFSDSLFIFTE